MRVKEWHRIIVRGLPVIHVLEPAYYRQGKKNVRIDGTWYCTECDDIVDMRLLSKQGFVRKTHLSAKYTSMFEKGLRFERKPRLSGQVVEEIDDLEEDQGQRKEHKLEPESSGKLIEEIRAYERSLLDRERELDKKRGLHNKHEGDKERELRAIEVPAVYKDAFSTVNRDFKASPSDDSRAKARAKRKAKKKRR